MGERFFGGKSGFCGILILLALTLGVNVATMSQTNVEMLHKGKIYEVPKAYLDPAFPGTDAGSAEYQDYVATHLFPLPEEGDYERRVERWTMNNRYYPQFLNSGNPQQDSVRYSMAVEVWKQKNEKAVAYLTRTVNTTSLSDDDFQLLYNSFPRKQDTGDAELDQRRYDDAVQEWIRIYSYEKYLIIEPIVREAELLNQKAEEGK